MIWLVGHRGMLGTAVERGLVSAGLAHIVSDMDVDITDSRAVEGFAGGRDVDVIINCAAYTAVDRAESEEEKAFAINATGPANLAVFAEKKGARLIHVSTDYVFDGTKKKPYTVSDTPNPHSAYGRSKLAGEKRIAELTGNYAIVRTAWLYGLDGPNFVATMLRLMEERDELGIVDDQRGSPTYAEDLAAALIAGWRSAEPGPGIYHFTNDGETTWYGFAKEIYSRASEMGLLSSECRIKPITTHQYPTPAARPANSILDKADIVQDWGVVLRPWQESLDDYLRELKTRRDWAAQEGTGERP